MKKNLLLLFITTLSFAQSVVEIRLANYNVGTPQTPVNSINNTTESNDPALNSILQSHNVLSYILKLGHPYGDYSMKYIQINCNNCNLNQLKTDLLNYSNVVSSSRVTTFGTPFDNVLYFQLQPSASITSSSLVNGIVVTSDANLNQIFQNFNVFHLSSNYVLCNCDNSQLKTALDNYSTFINSSQYANPSYLLGNQTFNSVKTKVSPNPFSDNFNIETENNISNYSLFDVSGKQIASTNSKLELDVKTQSLNAGFYILNLTFDNGEISNYKLVKK